MYFTCQLLVACLLSQVPTGTVIRHQVRTAATDPSPLAASSYSTKHFVPETTSCSTCDCQSVAVHASHEPVSLVDLGQYTGVATVSGRPSASVLG